MSIRVAARALRKSPGLVFVAVLALSIGIGITTAMFSIVYSALMRGLPYPDGDRVVVAYEQQVSRPDGRRDVSIHDYHDIRDQQKSFVQLAGYYNGTVNVSGTERAERYTGQWVTANIFDVLRVPPVLGRAFREGEDTPSGARVAVLSYKMWQNRYAGDRSVIGTILRANGQPFEIVGVMPDGYGFPEEGDIWLPLQLDAGTLKRGEGQHISLIGKLKPGVTLDQANVDLKGIARRLEAEHKELNDGITATVLPFVEGYIGKEPRQLLYTMLGAVFFVLLIACANVANLLLDRAAHRTKEVGIRTALGASRLAVIKQFLAEALILALAGAAIGVVAAHFGVAAFNRAIVDTTPPFWLDIRIHPPVLLFAIGTALVATLASGALPALQASRSDIAEILKDESRGASGFRVGKLSRALVIFEIALSCGLLVAAGLMIRSVANLRNIEPGFITADIFTARLGFPAGYTDEAKQKQFYLDLAQRLAAIPGATGASISSNLPGINSNSGAVSIEGRTYAKDIDRPVASLLAVSSGFFDNFGIRVREGRAFGSQDREDALPVAIVNQRFVEQQFKDASPLGKRVRVGPADSKAQWRTIVGVVPTTFGGDAPDKHPAMVYTPLTQDHARFVSLAVRTSGPPLAITQQVRDAVASLDPDIPLYWTYTMTEAMARPLWFVRVFGTMFMIFGGLALFLAAVGLYAVMAFSVSRRTREVGIRMALGAETAHVVGMIVRQGALQLAVGMGAGLAIALGVSTLLKAILFQVEPRDPLIFGAVAVVLVVAGLLATLIPARRATMVDPLVALRSE